MHSIRIRFIRRLISLSFKKFAARRALLREEYCDNPTGSRVKFSFTPPRALYFRGLWEPSAKQAIFLILRDGNNARRNKNGAQNRWFPAPLSPDTHDEEALIAAPSAGRRVGVKLKDSKFRAAEVATRIHKRPIHTQAP